MSITSAQYIANKEGVNSSIKATIDGNVVNVPISEDNRHYKEILAWAEEDGNEIQAAD